MAPQQSHTSVLKTQISKQARPQTSNSTGGNRSITSSQSGCLSSPLLLLLSPFFFFKVSSVLGKERQTHFHTNGVRACSPGTRWNCKYFIFAWKPCTITPWLLSSLFYFAFSLTFFFLLRSHISSLGYRGMLTLILWSSKSAVYRRNIHYN